jgi:hypothetical protein
VPLQLPLDQDRQFLDLFSSAGPPFRLTRNLVLGRATVSGRKLKIGQTVTYMSGPYGARNVGNTYRVTQLLPPEGDNFQYKIKNAAEPHERVAKKSQLSRAA